MATCDLFQMQFCYVAILCLSSLEQKFGNVFPTPITLYDTQMKFWKYGLEVIIIDELIEEILHRNSISKVFVAPWWREKFAMSTSCNVNDH